VRSTVPQPSAGKHRDPDPERAYLREPVERTGTKRGGSMDRRVAPARILVLEPGEHLAIEIVEAMMPEHELDRRDPDREREKREHKADPAPDTRIEGRREQESLRGRRQDRRLPDQGPQRVEPCASEPVLLLVHRRTPLRRYQKPL
jgi:hypothetical protein